MNAATLARPVATFYGDDFTGASDNLAQFHRHGLHSVLFFEPPSPGRLAALADRGGADVVGVAGVARSLPTAAMAAEIDPAIRSLAGLGAPLFQYKCCSTFDSTSAIGSLGEATRRMQQAWPDRAVAVLAAMPEFGRYTVFGNHFARFGEAVHRLDRHPVMRRHPSTPMTEADLGEILAAQGLAPGVSADVRLIDAATHAADLARALDWSAGPVIFDACTNAQLVCAAGAIWERAQSAGGMLALAAQGLAHGLGQYLQASGRVSRPPPAHSLPGVERLLVLSGSCSAITAEQIDVAQRAGWHVEALDPLGDAEALDSTVRDTAALAARLHAALERCGGAVVHTARGPDDPAVAQTRRRAQARSMAPDRLAAGIGAAYAAVIRGVLERGGLRRVVIAGGDSSSYTMRALGAWALEVVASSFADNAHVCRLLADDPLVDGLEVLLKGGQVGRPDLFARMRDGF
jgi:uncharacterized protein YgbK (DUF1537 family)